MPNKLSLEEEHALVKLITRGKEARRKLESDKEMLAGEERKELLACVGEGERAREELILAHIGLVHSIAPDLCRKYGCWDSRGELISDGYLKLIKSVDEFKPELGRRVATYAYKRIWGAMMNLLVKEKFAPPAEYESLDSSQGEDNDEPRKEFADPASNQEQDLIRLLGHDLLLRAIRKLHEPERTVVILRDLEGLSYEEIAECLKMPLGTAKSLRHRALAKLRVWLASPEKYLNGGGENA